MSAEADRRPIRVGDIVTRSAGAPLLRVAEVECHGRLLRFEGYPEFHAARGWRHYDPELDGE